MNPPGATVDTSTRPAGWGECHDLVAGLIGHDETVRYLASIGALVTVPPGDLPLVPEALADVTTGGKRLRPLLALCSALVQDSGAAQGLILDRVRVLASAVELLHIGSLVHDDVMDDSPVRHGRPSVNAVHGAGTAVLCGDYLIASAFARVASVGRREVGVLANAFVGLCEGQARETHDLYDVGRTEYDYFACVAGKTAALFASACHLGALGAHAHPEKAESLAEFGHCLGMAFQIIDDVLDIQQAAGTLGKPARQDLDVGVYTLPVVRAMPSCPAIAEALRDGDPEAAYRLIHTTSGISSALATARDWSMRAVAAAEKSSAPGRERAVGALSAMALSLIDRTY